MNNPEYKKPILKVYGSLKHQTRVIENGVGVRDNPSKGPVTNKTG